MSQLLQPLDNDFDVELKKERFYEIFLWQFHCKVEKTDHNWTSLPEEGRIKTHMQTLFFLLQFLSSGTLVKSL